ncbi:MAG: hypothetical protein HZB38_12930 [Planctomycetes bacterium]|nr:hypothetical protein [Planctomycetota bacterium]
MVLAALAVSRVPPLSVPAIWLLLAWVPGRLLLAATGIAAECDSLQRLILACGFSLAVAPLLLDPLWHFTNDPHGLLLPVWLLLTLAGLIIRLWGTAAQSHPQVRLFAQARSKIAIGLAAILVAAFAIGPYWPRAGGEREAPSAIHDYIKHHAVLWSLERHPLPLGNPFFADGAREPAHYYHYFYLIPATVRAVCPQVSIGLAFSVQAALIALTTAGLASMLARRIFGGDGPALLAFVLTTVVGGFDLIPVAFILRSPVITLDAWADTLIRIHSLLTQMVWTPQNVQGVTIVLLAAYVLSQRFWWRGWLWLGPLLGASLIGSTIWIAAVALPALAILIGPALLAGSADLTTRVKRAAGTLFVAAGMLALSLPSLRGYIETSQRHGKGLTIEWTVHQSHALLGRLVAPGPLANLLDLPWVLFFELGPLLLFPLLLPRQTWRRIWSDAGTRWILIAAGLAVVGFVTVRSHFTYNDFGQKVTMLTLIAGAVCGAGLVASELTRPSWINPLGWCFPPRLDGAPRRALPIVFAIALFLGCPVAVWQSPLAAARRFVSPDGPLARIATALPASDAAAVRYLRESSPPGAVVLAHWGVERLTLQQLIDRQIAIAELEQDTHVFQGRDPAIQELALQEIRAALTGDASAVEVHAVLTRHGVTHVLMGSVEREKWTAAAALHDAEFFKTDFAVPGAEVIQLR